VQQSGSTKDAAIDLPLTDSQIASLLGISAQQFSAVKRKLNRAGGAQYLKGRRAWIVSPAEQREAGIDAVFDRNRRH